MSWYEKTNPAFLIKLASGTKDFWFVVYTYSDGTNPEKKLGKKDSIE